MITIKLRYKSSYNFSDLQRQYSILVKYCYNRLLDGIKDKEIRRLCKLLNNINDLDSRFVENAILDAKTLLKTNDKVIFNRTNFIKRSKGKISKEEFKESKYLSLVNYGEKLKKGNRKFEIDTLNNKIIFKLNRNEHIDIYLPKLKQNYKKELIKLEELMKENKISVSFRVNSKYLYISYEEIAKESNLVLKDNRILGIDLNPNNIGVSILEFNTNNEYSIIYKSYIDLSKNNTYNKDKKNYNIILISKQLIQLMKSFNVRNIAIEDLNINTKQHNKGKLFNRLVNNTWNRNLFVNNLAKRCKINNILVYMINPAYTSVIGNLKYDYFDPINSSIEVARRGYMCNKMFIKNSFYPVFNLKDQWNQWKKDTDCSIIDWINFYKHLKTLKLKYRVPNDNLVYKKECIKRIEFYNY